MLIEYYNKNVYGKTISYIKEPSKTFILNRLTGKKTISPEDIYYLEQLGLKLKLVLEPQKIDKQEQN